MRQSNKNKLANKNKLGCILVPRVRSKTDRWRLVAFATLRLIAGRLAKADFHPVPYGTAEGDKKIEIALGYDEKQRCKSILVGEWRLFRRV